MPLELVTIPCLKDNYAFLIHDEESGQTSVIDVPEAAPILAALAARGWELSDILLTHHHDDHIAGVPELRAKTGALVTGAEADIRRLPPLDLAVSEGMSVTIGREFGQVIDVPGHTVGHIAFYFPQSGLVFTGDSLMAMGCGRLFEGTPAQMWESLSKLAALPPDTLVCSGHEYTSGNARFALSLEPDEPAIKSRASAVEQARANGQPTVPSRLSDELATNPFLRASNPRMKAVLGMDRAQDAAVFGEIRARKDRF
ncbi:hydroxyacylglutathione hydrolase [Tabrizicola sp. J26]|uniref:hydroxyacylglutathione hydrolase n=1 Tax=Alitabrizicola rongguiensis TaxID=2909234 RepID=UPI001F38D7E3|nr:hydroxyacylglutathione hydrolase [Tabrizicola rongguiensis]MCF1710506.1 hydroxyacylglutathione hydrolase [Tabrizicola rongguiensis]